MNTTREAGAVGANWAFAPIIDIDTNFRNPITNTRTFGSDPKRVRDMGQAYVKRVQELGFAAFIKHFLGDGQDERDQHLVTSINSMDCETWMQTYGEAYKAGIEADSLTAMIGHIMQPAWTKKLNPEIRDKDIMPATLSPELMQGLLRGILGFNGLICTDATTMAGYTLAMSRRDAVPESIARGADMFLFARNLEKDYGVILDGIRRGIITPERLDEAVTRILATKAARGPHKVRKPLDKTAAKEIIGCTQHKAWAMDCADQAITLVKEQEGVLPITPNRYSKPDPEVFLKAAQFLGSESKDCLAVEDAVSGAEVGHRGGLKVACVGDASDAGVGDYSMKSIAELVDIARG